MSELEDILLHAELVTQPAHLQLLSDWQGKIAHINNSLPESKLGDKLLEAIKQQAKSLTTQEANQLLEIARFRLYMHTRQGKYKSQYRGIDDNLDQLPGLMYELKQSAAAEGKKGELVEIFFDYSKMHNPDLPIAEFKACYQRFVKVKEFYDTVPENCRDLPDLRDDLAKGDWNELRNLLMPVKSKEDSEYAHWAKEFERVEKECNVNFRDVKAFISKYKRTHPQ